jgi:hypothetical protein
MAISRMACGGPTTGVGSVRADLHFTACPTIGSCHVSKASTLRLFPEGLGCGQSRVGLRYLRPSSTAICGSVSVSCRWKGAEEITTFGARLNSSDGRKGLKYDSLICRATEAETFGEANVEPQQDNAGHIVKFFERIVVIENLKFPQN